MISPEQLSPIFALALYMGLVSGYIPSPLYDKGERWPKWYQHLQIALLVLTAARFRFRSNPVDEDHASPILRKKVYSFSGDDDPYWIQLLDFILFDSIGIYYKDPYELFVEGQIMRVWDRLLACCIIFWVVSVLEKRRMKISSVLKSAPELSVKIVTRNLIAFSICCFVGVWRSLQDRWGTYETSVCPEYNPKRRWLMHADDGDHHHYMSVMEALRINLNVWPELHPPHFWWLRINHFLVSLTFLLALSQRSWLRLTAWLIFFEIEMAPFLGDRFHEEFTDGNTFDALNEYQRLPQGCYVVNGWLFELTSHANNIHKLIVT